MWHPRALMSVGEAFVWQRARPASSEPGAASARPLWGLAPAFLLGMWAAHHQAKLPVRGEHVPQLGPAPGAPPKGTVPPVLLPAELLQTLHDCFCDRDSPKSPQMTSAHISCPPLPDPQLRISRHVRVFPCRGVPGQEKKPSGEQKLSQLQDICSPGGSSARLQQEWDQDGKKGSEVR